jgi:hypothetical protein
MIRKSTHYAATIGIALAMLLGPLSITASFAQNMETPIAYGDKALIRDATQYANTMGVGLDEAVTRLKLQGAIGELNRVLTEKEADTFAGLWIQHQPSYRVIVRFTNVDNPNLKSYFDESLVDIAELRSAKLSLVQLEEARSEAASLADRLEIPASSAVNVITNQAELYVLNPASLDVAVRQAAAQLPPNVEVIEFEELPTPVADIFGGKALASCTSGFSVVYYPSGEKGVTTAGHCSNSQSFNGVGLIFKWGTPDYPSGLYDIQWHKTDHAFTVRNLVFDGAYNRFIYNYKFRTSQAIGEWVCKYGMITGYACGTIATNAQDGVNVRIDNLSANFGDSGGPWFYNNTAYGSTQSKCTLSNGQPCVIYGPVDHIYNQLQVSILTN